MATSNYRESVTVMREGMTTSVGNEPHNAVEVTLSFSEGGINYFNYKMEPKGYNLTVTPVRVERHEATGMTSTSFMMFTGGGRKFFVEPATRRVPKAFKALKERIMPKAEAIADAFIAGNLEAVREMVGAIPVPEVSL